MGNHEVKRWTGCSYQAADLETVLSLVRSRPEERRGDYPDLNDCRELLDLFQAGNCVRLWKDFKGCLAGYAILHGESYASLVFESAEGAAFDGLGAEILGWAEEVFRCEYRGQAAGISTSARSGQARRLQLLGQDGYVRQSEEVLHMVRPLNLPIPITSLPDGFSIRPLTGKEEAADWVALHQVAFGTRNMTLAGKLAMMSLPDYDPGLDLVAVAPDGSLAAYVVCSFNREENALSGQAVGHTDPVGTHPRHRRKGLARALLLHGLTLLEQRGLKEARLGTSSENLAMQRAAASAGFTLNERSLLFYKELLPQRSV